MLESWGNGSLHLLALPLPGIRAQLGFGLLSELLWDRRALQHLHRSKSLQSSQPTYLLLDKCLQLDFSISLSSVLSSWLQFPAFPLMGRQHWAHISVWTSQGWEVCNLGLLLIPALLGEQSQLTSSLLLPCLCKVPAKTSCISYFWRWCSCLAACLPEQGRLWFNLGTCLLTYAALRSPRSFQLLLALIFFYFYFFRPLCKMVYCQQSVPASLIKTKLRIFLYSNIFSLQRVINSSINIVLAFESFSLLAKLLYCVRSAG